VLDISIMVLFLLFAIVDVFTSFTTVSALLAGVLFIFSIIRLVDWYTHGIWKKPLLWILYLGNVWIAVGFLLKASVVLSGLSPAIAVHAFTAGGIGMMTLGMMARVSLGHTGRNVFSPPSSLFWVFLMLSAGVVLRVLFPLLFGDYYTLWIVVSQLLWIAAFVMFVFIYTPILVKPRVDGRYG